MKPEKNLYLRTEGLEQEAESFLASGVLNPEPLWIVDTAAARYGEEDPQVLLALALVLQAQQRGHVGLALREAERALPVLEPRMARDRDGEEKERPAPRWRRDRAVAGVELAAQSAPPGS